METSLQSILKFEARIRGYLNLAGGFVSLLLLRLLLGYEFFTSGLTKFNGKNWFRLRRVSLFRSPSCPWM